MFGERFVNIGQDQEWTHEKPEPEPKSAGTRREFLKGLAATFTALTVGCNKETTPPPTIQKKPVPEEGTNAREKPVPIHTETTKPEPVATKQNETEEIYQSPNVRRLELNEEESDQKENEKLKEYLNSMISASRNNFVIIDFSADWCGACNYIKPFFEKGADRIAAMDIPVIFSNIHLVDGATVDDGRFKVMLNFLKDVYADRKLIGYYQEVNSFGLPLIIYLHKGKLVKLQNAVGEFKTGAELTQPDFDAFIDRCLDGDCGSYFDEGQKNKPPSDKSPNMFRPVGDTYRREHGVNALHDKGAKWKGVKRKKTPLF